MAMLAERKRKQKWSLNPRGKHWSDDVNKFGQKMLEKMGWSAGKGLGRHENGMTEHVKVNYKNDSRGMGFKDNGEQWTKHENNFTSLLESLGGSGNNSDTTIQKPDRSLEEKSRTSRARVHYHKFTRGKDLSLKSEKDLANIFGRKTLEKTVEPLQEPTPEPETSENKEFGVVTVAAGSMADYFKSKFGKISNAFTNDPELTSSSNAFINLGFNPVDESCTKKKKKVTFASPEADDGTTKNDENIIEEETPKKSKKKKKKSHDEEIGIDNPACEVFNLDETIQTEEMNNSSKKYLADEKLALVTLLITKMADKLEMTDSQINKDSNTETNIQIKSTKSRNRRKKHSDTTINAESEKTQSDGLINDTEFNPGCTISIKDIRMAMEAFNIQQKPAKTPEEAMNKQYQFWNTQPVPKMDEKITSNEFIEQDKDISEIRAEPYSLPDGFQWDTLNLDEPLVLKELYMLLNENYVEDDDCMFRFDYPPDFLKWALQPPGWKREWHCGVRVIKSSRLVGFISAIPATLQIYEQALRMVEINFLCVHKKLRSKRVAPVLIREITRRVHFSGIFQAVYTAGVVLPKPVGTCRYWHRSLNPKKLIEVKFSHLSRNMTMQRTLKLYKLPDQPKTPGFRKMTVADVPKAHMLLKEYLSKFNLAPIFSEEDFRHWFLPQVGIVDSFVVMQDNEITDFVSYYTLPSTVMHHPVHKSLKAAYSFYNVSTRTAWIDLMSDALISAKQLGFDVFNALDLMDNKEFLEPLKFGIGDGNLQYYLYNWRCPSMPPSKIGLVLQ
ncbi:N-myristoyl transferase [Carabus blaptoides fortunei]